MYKYIDCIDAGTEYCPCHLAEEGECILCSQLNGDKFCDCVNWKGTCIYHEYLWNNNKAKHLREYCLCDIMQKQFIRKDIIKIKVHVGKYLARELSNIGGFVFLKMPGSSDAFGTPISVMKTNIDEESAEFVFKIVGVKTKTLSTCSSSILVKGPYYNGVQGRVFIDNLKNAHCLFVTRGMAAAPSYHTCDILSKRNCISDIVLDKGKSEFNFARNDFKQLGCNITDTTFYSAKDKFDSKAKDMVMDKIYNNKYDVIILGGSDDFYRFMIPDIYKYNNFVKISTINNSIMCCGEGICGSCEIIKPNGEVIRGCKQQYNPVEIFLGGMR